MSNSQPGSVSNKRLRLEGPAGSFLSSTPIDYDDEPRRKSATPTPDARQVQDPKLLHHLDGHTIVRHSHNPFAAGGFCDIFIGNHEVYGKVAMRRPRITVTGYTINEMNAFFDESKLWKKLRHPNILQFIGLIQSDGYIWAISRFAENGSLPKYLKHHPETDRRALVLQLADAVRYLHREGVVHGDIKGSNILASVAVTVLLCDFGLSKLADTRTRPSLEGAASIRWCAPEVLMERKPKTFASDVYSFGMSIYEILSGEMPFHTIANEFVIGMQVKEGVRPSRGSGGLESGDMDELWNVIVESWDGDPSKRPTMEAVCERLGVPVTLPMETTVEATSTFGPMHLHSPSSTPALAGDGVDRGFAPPRVDRVTHHHGHDVMIQQTSMGRKTMIASPSMSTSFNTVSATEKPKNQVSAEEMLIRNMPRAHARYNDISTKPSRPCHPGTRAPLLQSIRNWIDDDGTDDNGGIDDDGGTDDGDHTNDDRTDADGTDTDSTNTDSTGTDSAASPIFWLCGEVGVGKTTVAHTIAKEQDALGQLGASFFFNRDNDRRRDPALFATTIAYQLTRFDTHAHQQVADTLQPDVDVVHRGLEEQFLKLVVEPLVSIGESSSRKIIIVIDGLDECSDPAALLDVLPLLTRYPLSRLRVLVTSRPHASIVTMFQSPRLCHLTSQTHFRDIDDKTLDNDVRAYLEWSLGEIASEHLLPSPWPSPDEGNKLVEMAGGLMVIASLFERYIRDPIEGNPPEQLKRILSRRKAVGGSATAELDSLYDMVLNDAKRLLSGSGVRLARSLLQLHFLPEDHCSVGDMCKILDCTLADAQSVLRRFTSVIFLQSGEDDEDDYITPFHASFGEYLCDPERCSVTKFLIEPTSSRVELAITFLDTFIRAAENGIKGLNYQSEDDVPRDLLFSFYELPRCLAKASGPSSVQLQQSRAKFCLDAISIWICIWWLCDNNCYDYELLRDIKKARLTATCKIKDVPSLQRFMLKFILNDITHLFIRRFCSIGSTDGSKDEGSCIVHEAELEVFKHGLYWHYSFGFMVVCDPRTMALVLRKWSTANHPNILPLRGIDFPSLQKTSNPKLIIQVPFNSHYPTLRHDRYPSLVRMFQQNADTAVETLLGISHAIPYLERIRPVTNSPDRRIFIEDIVLSKEGKFMIHPLPFVHRQGHDHEEDEDCCWDDIDTPPFDDAGRKSLSERGFTCWDSPGIWKGRNDMVWSFGCVIYELMSGEPPLKRYHEIVMGSELVDDEPMDGESPLQAYRDLIKSVETRNINGDGGSRTHESDYWHSCHRKLPEGYSFNTRDLPNDRFPCGDILSYASGRIHQRRYRTAVNHLLNDLQFSEDLKGVLRSCWEVKQWGKPTIENITDRLAAILEALRNQDPEAI